MSVSLSDEHDLIPDFVGSVWFLAKSMQFTSVSELAKQEK
jgi:hypothetical protein